MTNLKLPQPRIGRWIAILAVVAVAALFGASVSSASVVMLGGSQGNPGLVVTSSTHAMICSTNPSRSITISPFDVYRASGDGIQRIWYQPVLQWSLPSDGTHWFAWQRKPWVSTAVNAVQHAQFDVVTFDLGLYGGYLYRVVLDLRWTDGANTTQIAAANYAVDASSTLGNDVKTIPSAGAACYVA